MVVISRFPFLDQLTAISQKYMGTSSISSSALISLWAMSTFLHSVSRIGGLNCSIRWCGLAFGLVLAAADGCCGTAVVFQVGLIAVGLADFTQCGGGVVLVCRVVVLVVGCGFGTVSSSCVIVMLPMLGECITDSAS